MDGAGGAGGDLTDAQQQQQQQPQSSGGAGERGDSKWSPTLLTSTADDRNHILHIAPLSVMTVDGSGEGMFIPGFVPATRELDHIDEARVVGVLAVAKRRIQLAKLRRRNMVLTLALEKVEKDHVETRRQLDTSLGIQVSEWRVNGG